MCLELLFNDRRMVTLLILMWTLLSCGIFAYIMIEDNSRFLNMGPSDKTELFGVKLNSWFIWWCVAIYTFVSTAIAAFASDSVMPWITNTIQDHKTKYIPYSNLTCWIIIQVFTFYVVTQSVIGLFVALTQVDFMLIRLGADVIVNHFTTQYFLKDKIYDPQKYNQSQAGDTDAQNDSDRELDQLVDQLLVEE